LEENLGAIAGGEGLKVGEVIFELITWAERCGRTDQLIVGSCQHASGNPKLRDFAKQYPDLFGAKVVLPQDNLKALSSHESITTVPSAPRNVEESPTDSYNWVSIRRLLEESFTRDQLDAFWHDYFLDSYTTTEPREMSKVRMITELLEYCRQESRVPELLRLLETHRPGLYRGVLHP